MRRISGRRMDAERVVTSESATAVTVVRRLGYVAAKVHESVMASLIRQGEQATAERFNDVFKPLVDMLLGFSLEEDSDGPTLQG